MSFKIMSYRPFKKEVLESIKSKVLKAKEQNPGPHYAAFDADGTLWNSDLGEQFFQYQIDHCQLQSIKNRDPWHYYESTKSVDPVKAYLWLAQISKGISLTQVRSWAKKSVELNPPKIFEEQKEFKQK
jgi:hypothetical protein